MVLAYKQPEYNEYQNNGGQWSKGMSGTNAPKNKVQYWRYSPGQVQGQAKAAAPRTTMNADVGERGSSPYPNAGLTDKGIPVFSDMAINAALAKTEPWAEYLLNMAVPMVKKSTAPAYDAGAAGDVGVGGIAPSQINAPVPLTPAQIANNAEIQRLLGVAGGKGLKSAEQAKLDYENAVRNMASSQSSVIGLAPGAMQSNLGAGIERAVIQQDLGYQTKAQEERQAALEDAFKLLMAQYGAEMADRERKTKEEQLDWLLQTQPELVRAYRDVAGMKTKTPSVDWGSLAAGSLASGAAASLPSVGKRFGWTD